MTPTIGSLPNAAASSYPAGTAYARTRAAQLARSGATADTVTRWASEPNIEAFRMFILLVTCLSVLWRFGTNCEMAIVAAASQETVAE
jgi:hypothetical protein